MDMKQKLVAISGIIFLVSCCAFGLFGIPVGLILSGATGTVVGFYKKDRLVWIPSISALSAGVLFIVVFFILLSHSNM